MGLTKLVAHLRVKVSIYAINKSDYTNTEKQIFISILNKIAPVYTFISSDYGKY